MSPSPKASILSTTLWYTLFLLNRFPLTSVDNMAKSSQSELHLFKTSSVWVRHSDITWWSSQKGNSWSYLSQGSANTGTFHQVEALPPRVCHEKTQHEVTKTTTKVLLGFLVQWGNFFLPLPVIKLKEELITLTLIRKNILANTMMWKAYLSGIREGVK